MNTHRNIGRPIYNDRRLKEHPVPSLGHHSQARDSDEERNLDLTDSSISDVSTQNESAELSIEPSVNESIRSNENSLQNAVENVGPEVNDSMRAGGDSSTDRIASDSGDVSAEAMSINSTNNGNEDPLAQVNDSMGANGNHSTDRMSHDASEVAIDMNLNLSNNGDEDADDPLALDVNDSMGAGGDNSADRIASDDGDASEAAMAINSNSSTNGEVDPLVIIKTEVPMHEFHAVNNDEIDEILEEVEEIVCGDGIVMSVGKSGVPMPWAATDDKLIKRQKDSISGDIPFNCIVSRFFLINFKIYSYNTTLNRDYLNFYIERGASLQDRRIIYRSATKSNRLYNRMEQRAIA